LRTLSITALASISPQQSARTIQDLLDRLGNITASRVRMRPAPGTATEEDVVFVQKQLKKKRA